MKLHAILHASFEGLGYYETWAKEQGITIQSTRCYRGETLPSLEDFDILLLMGGPQSPIEIDKFPYLKDEIQFIKEAINRDKYVIGVCLGTQLISESYGAKTERSPNKEMGVFPLTLTTDGEKDPIFSNFPSHFLSGHWHNDMPGIPPDAKIMATSDGCPRQIVRYTPKVYGFQCHLEFNKAYIEKLIEKCPEDLKENSTYVQSPKSLLSHNYDEINGYLKLFLKAFLYADY